jgi:hypothetical protein
MGLESKMARYMVTLRGEDFLLRLEKPRLFGLLRRQVNAPALYGFFTTRYVDAASPEEAESKAVELVNADPKLHAMTLNARESPPSIFLEEVAVIDAQPSDEVRGYTFFPAET